MTTTLEDPATSFTPPKIDLPATLLDRLGDIEAIVSECALPTLGQTTPLRRALTLARGMQELERMIDHDIMVGILPLMNSPLGFRTDCDPARPSYDSEGRERKRDPYSEDQVKTCFIESLIHGLLPVNNEWNIIGGNCYAAKNGLRRKLLEWPRLTELKVITPPAVWQERRALVKGKITWKLAGQPMALESELAIRINKGMGDDAILGKSHRKLYYAALQELSGGIVTIPEGDAGDPDAINTTSRPAGGHSPERQPGPAGPVSADNFTSPRGANNAADHSDNVPEIGKERTELLTQFGALRPLVGKQRLQDYIGCPINDATAEQLVELRRLLVRIQTGDITWAAAWSARFPDEPKTGNGKGTQKSFTG